ncbi:transposase [uncultured Chryseobacterium sp.]|uniref:transposase n=1 Tax=uncultured Chryseobacterium sp. TaxID=259322 RepID=UPI0025FA6978|nr:transposase [uncultured Chryseobacterium sp.]
MINTESFEFDSVYHVFSHVNGKELIFREETNYQFFLKKLMQYILPIADIYAYCLMANHFHLLVRFKNFENIPIENEHAHLMKHFGNFLNSYAKAFNKMYERKGALFLNAIKRKKITDQKYLLKVLHYIHNNPVNHGLVKDIRNWKYSSYHSYINIAKSSHIERTEMMKYFDTVNDFIAYHQSNVEYDFIQTS